MSFVLLRSNDMRLPGLVLVQVTKSHTAYRTKIKVTKLSILHTELQTYTARLQLGSRLRET